MGGGGEGGGLDGKLYSIDYSKQWYRDKNKLSGFIVDSYPELKENWKLFAGGLSLRFLDEIGEGIDFALIDTMHINPGEFFDFLMVLPFLKDDATVVFHDTQLHTTRKYRADTHTNCLLMSAIYGEKIIPEYLSKNNNGKPIFPNIGAIKINSDTKKRLFEVFNLLTIRWSYIPNDNDLLETLTFFSKYYDLAFVEYLKDIIIYQKENFGCFNPQIKQMENEIKELRTSTSWKATKLLRSAKKRVMEINQCALKIVAWIKNRRK